MNNYTIHKASLIRKWLAKRPRRQIHLTPTCASWMNQAEGFLGLLREKQIRRGIHRSVDSLHRAIEAFITQHKAEPRPFWWTRSADDILASIERFYLRTAPE